MSTDDKAKLDAAEPIGVTAAIAHLQERNAPTISERIIQGFLCDNPDAEATKLADKAPQMNAALNKIFATLRGDLPLTCEVKEIARTAIAQVEGKDKHENDGRT